MAKLLMTTTIYGIRHKPSGYYMPVLRTGRGYSWLTTEDFSSTPRLFWSRRAATLAITRWLQGPLSLGSIIKDSWGIAVDYDSGGEPIGPPPITRIAEDLEIVEFTLTEQPGLC